MKWIDVVTELEVVKDLEIRAGTGDWESVPSKLLGCEIVQDQGLESYLCDLRRGKFPVTKAVVRQLLRRLHEALLEHLEDHQRRLEQLEKDG